LLGSLLALVALGLHAVALGRGGVIVVQAVLSGSLIVALGIEAAAERRLLRPIELGGSVVLITGVVLLLGWGRPGGGLPVDATVQAATAVILVVVAGVGLTASRMHHRVRTSAVMMGAAAGVCFALDAVFLKGVANFVDDLDALLAVTNLIGFVIASVLGNVIVQRAYQRAPLRTVLPAVTAADPLAAFAVGWWLLHERLQGGDGSGLAVAAGLAAIAAGIVIMTTRSAHS
jgi:drug/metabolite transporter (DMT)-like permease